MAEDQLGRNHRLVEQLPCLLMAPRALTTPAPFPLSRPPTPTSENSLFPAQPGSRMYPCLPARPLPCIDEADTCLFPSEEEGPNLSSSSLTQVGIG